MMKRLPFAMLVLVSACASTPKVVPPAELILGTWACEIVQNEVTTKGDVTYLSDGTFMIKANVSLKVAGQVAEVVGDGTANWAFLEDGQLQQELTALKVTSGQLGGKPLPVAMVQPMVDAGLLHKVTLSTATVTPTSLIMSGEGSEATCSR